MITQEKYNQMWQAVNAGKITEITWAEFCREYLRQMLSQPEAMAMLTRLKYRGE